MATMRPNSKNRNGSLDRRGRPGGLGAWILALLVSTAAAEPPELGPELLPPRHPIWADLEELWNRGGLTDLPVFTRPLPRREIAESFAGTLAGRPDLAGTGAARRIARELAFELERLGESLGPPETRPLLQWEGEKTTIRAQLEGDVLGRVLDDQARLIEGTSFGVFIRGYLPGRAFVLAEASIEKIESGNPLGDSIVKGSDWYLSSRSAYLAVATPFVDVAAGLFRNRWGPGSSGTLLLSDASLSYPGIFFGKTFAGGMGRFVATTASLHRPEERWFSAHRLEFAFGRSLRLGVHESAAYSSNGFETLYVIGVVPYTLVQRFLDRTTSEGGDVLPHRNNVMVGLDAVWRFGHGLRLDGELLIDDFATETSTQPNRIGYELGASWAGSLLGQPADARIEFVKVYRYTYSVFYGANHLHDGVPLGYEKGPDVEHALSRLDRDFGASFRAGLGLDVTRSGEGFPGEFWDPDDPQSANSGSRLSGTVERRIFPHLRARFVGRDLLDVRGRIGPEIVTNRDHEAGADRTILRGELVARYQW